MTSAFQRSLQFFGTGCGKQVDYIDPRSDQIDIDDIAVGLSRQYRGLGQDPSTVAQHSIIAAYCMFDVQKNVVPLPKAACRIAPLCALFHDGHETYVGDMPRPFKVAFEALWGEAFSKTQDGETPPFPLRVLEAQLDAAIHRAFDLPVPTGEVKNAVSYCDWLGISFEMRDILTPGRYAAYAASGYSFPPPPENVEMFPLSPQEAHRNFHQAFDLLRALREGLSPYAEADLVKRMRDLAGLRPTAAPKKAPWLEGSAALV